MTAENDMETTQKHDGLGEQDGPGEPNERLSIVRTLEDYKRLYARSIQDSDGFWKEQSGILDWFHPPHTVLDANIEEIDFDWFPGGKLNVAFNCSSSPS